MAYDKDKLQQLHDAALPLMEFIEANHDPHTHAIVDAESVVLSEGIAGIERVRRGVVDCHHSRVVDDIHAIQIESDLSFIRPQLRAFIEKWLGDRCPDYDADCHNCQHWQAFDLLMENQFKNDVA